jgi:hypothetical protein
MSEVKLQSAGERSRSSDSSFDRVKRFLRDLDAGRVTEKDVKQIEQDVYVVLGRLERVHRLGPQFENVELSPHMRRLLKLVGRKKLIMRFPLLSKAAAL